MTAAPQPLGRLTAILEGTVGTIAWGTQAAAATFYVVIGVRPSVWQPLLHEQPASVIATGCFVFGMAGMWGLSLWEEQRRFYDRFIQRSRRKLALWCHFSVLFVAAASAADSRDRLWLWAGLGIAALGAVATWASWMSLRLLPDEDQAVIDEVISREVAQHAAIHEAAERERRRARLTGILGSLGYTLPADPPAPATDPAVKWTIPKGKHAPLVYFISNGNRIKIGTTTDLKRRIRTLALREDNVVLLVAGDHRVEREYHRQFAAHRVGRTEWFAYEGTLADYVHDQITQKGQEK